MPETNGPSSAELCDLLLATGEPRVWEEMHAALVAIARRHGLIETPTAHNTDSVKLRLTRDLTDALAHRAAGAHASTYLTGRINEPGIAMDDDGALMAWDYDGQERIVVTEADITPPAATCKHCGRSITFEGGHWIDPEADGDDVVWRETCDSHDTFTAEHEPADVTPEPDPTPAKLKGLSDINWSGPATDIRDELVEIWFQRNHWVDRNSETLADAETWADEKFAENAEPRADEDTVEPDPALVELFNRPSRLDPTAKPAVVIVTDAEIDTYQTQDVDVFVYPAQESAADLRRDADMLEARGLVEAARTLRRMAAGEP